MVLRITTPFQNHNLQARKKQAQIEERTNPFGICSPISWLV
jgi:hypothetical protein